MMKMICSNCHSEITEDSKFCGHCGARVAMGEPGSGDNRSQHQGDSSGSQDFVPLSSLLAPGFESAEGAGGSTESQPSYDGFSLEDEPPTGVLSEDEPPTGLLSADDFATYDEPKTGLLSDSYDDSRLIGDSGIGDSGAEPWRNADSSDIASPNVRQDRQDAVSEGRKESESGCQSAAGTIIIRIVLALIAIVIIGVVTQCRHEGETLGTRGGETVVSSSSAAVADVSSSAAASALPDASGSANSPSTVVCEYEGVRYSVPSSWYEQKNADGGYYYRVSYASGANFQVSSADLQEDIDVSSIDEIGVDALTWGLQEHMQEIGATEVETETFDIGGCHAIRCKFNWYHEAEEGDKVAEHRFEVDEYIFVGSGCVELAGVCGLGERSRLESQFVEICDSVTLA